MFCQRCGKNIATVKYVQIINGVATESNLCKPCYMEICDGGTPKNNGDIWAGLFGSDSTYVREKRCPVCGTSYSDYERTGLLGCANCYEVFRDQLIPSVRRIQGKVNHVGKTAAKSDIAGQQEKLKYLQEQLEIALRERRYNDADKLNRQIDAINKNINGGGDND